MVAIEQCRLSVFNLNPRHQATMLQGMESYCIRAFAEALEVIPYTLAENAGLNPIEMVTELRNKHARGETSAGINVRKGQVTNMMEENVVQPLLVTTSAITLACECVRMILKVCAINSSIQYNNRITVQLHRQTQ